MGCFSFLEKSRRGESNQSKATVRWSVARCGADRIDTLIYSIPLGSTKKEKHPIWVFLPAEGNRFAFAAHWAANYGIAAEAAASNSPLDCCISIGSIPLFLTFPKKKSTPMGCFSFLVEPRGIEPLSESNLERTSPGAVCYLHSLNRTGTNTLTESVAS